MIAHSCKIECDEDGFHLIVSTDGCARFDFRLEDPAELVSALAPVIEWLAEAASVRRIFESAADAYDLDDPKHPTYHERMSALWDNREKV